MAWKDKVTIYRGSLECVISSVRYSGLLPLSLGDYFLIAKMSSLRHIPAFDSASSSDFRLLLLPNLFEEKFGQVFVKILDARTAIDLINL